MSERDPYPLGFRVSEAGQIIEEGAATTEQTQGEMWTFRTCEPCADSGAPLCADHPLRDSESMVLGPDGMVLNAI